MLGLSGLPLSFAFATFLLGAMINAFFVFLFLGAIIIFGLEDDMVSSAFSVMGRQGCKGLANKQGLYLEDRADLMVFTTVHHNKSLNIL